jgi:hypothetical protein
LEKFDYQDRSAVSNPDGTEHVKQQIAFLASDSLYGRATVNYEGIRNVFMLSKTMSAIFPDNWI